MSSRFHVRVASDDLVFSAAHFLTFGPQDCERLHGHNYRVAAEVAGPLGPDQYVVDFAVVRKALCEILAELDHRVLLPGEHPGLRVADNGGEVELRWAGRRWLFPSGDCILLPMANTTAELLAEHVAGRLIAALAARSGFRPDRVRVEVEECFGQTAVCER